MEVFDPKQFVVDVPKEFLCCCCHNVPSSPISVDCCEAIFCQACIDPINEDKKPCPNPNCSKVDFRALLSPREKKKIGSFIVHCNMKERGCEWEGTLEQFSDHHKDECIYTQCQKCSKAIKKGELDNHQENECQKREYKCDHCGHESTYEFIMEQHKPECPKEVVECALQCIGCTEKFPRDEEKNHMEQSTNEHFFLLVKDSQNMRGVFKETLQQKDETIRDLKQQLDALENQRAEEREDDKKITEELIQKLSDESDKKLQERVTILEQSVQQGLKKMGEQMAKLVQDRNQEIQTTKEELLELSAKSQAFEEQIEAVSTETERKWKVDHDELSTKLEEKHSTIGKLEEKFDEAVRKVQNDIALLTQTAADTKAQSMQSLERLKAELDSHIHKEMAQRAKLEASTTESLQELHQQVTEIEAKSEQEKTAVQTHFVQTEVELRETIESSESSLKEAMSQVGEYITESKQQTDQEIEAHKREWSVQIASTQKSVQDLAMKIGRNDAEIDQLKSSLLATDGLAKEVKVNNKHLEAAFYKDKQQILRLNLATGFPPYYIELTDVSQMTLDKPWVSPYMYTHPQGYKFAIGAAVNNKCASDGMVQITTFFWITKGEYDSFLHWPANIQLRLELLDQTGNMQHDVSKTKFKWFKTSHPKNLGCIADDTYTKAKYLRGDTLQFRISEIRLTVPSVLNDSDVLHRSF